MGHANSITGLQFLNGRVLSADASGHWNIWNYSTGHIVANGDGVHNGRISYRHQPYTPQIAVAGDIAVLPLANAVQLRNLNTGALIATIAAPGMNLNDPIGGGAFGPWWQLASEGSYLVIGSYTSLDFYSPAGDKIRSVAGNYIYGMPFAAPGKAMIALGPKGLNVIQSISPNTGASTVSSKFIGTFSSWFGDGSHFASSSGATSYIYSNTAALKALVSVPVNTTIAGLGNWYWTNSSSGLAVSKIGSRTPAYTTIGGGTLVLSGTTLADLAPNPFCANSADPSCSSPGDRLVNITLVDLAGAAPLVSQYYESLSPWGAFASDASGNWLLGNANGVLFDVSGSQAKLRYFGYGRVQSIAGSGPTIAAASNRVAIATSTGQILFFNPNPAAPVLEGSESFPATQLAMSANGAVLAASESGQVVIESLPSGETLASFGAGSLSLSASGTVVGVLNPPNSFATSVSDATQIWSSNNATASTPVLLSPNGTLIAQSNGLEETTGSSTIWKNGDLLSVIPGLGIGWIDNNRILATQYEHLAAGGDAYASSAIYSASGKLLTSLPYLPLLTSLQPVNSTSIYDPGSNIIWPLTANGLVWGGSVSPYAGAGSISGIQVVYAAGHTVVTETY